MSKFSSAMISFEDAPWCGMVRTVIGMGGLVYHPPLSSIRIDREIWRSVSSEGPAMDRNNILMVDPDPMKSRIYKGKLIRTVHRS